MIKKTFKELQDIDNEVGAMYRVNPDLQNTKFGYAYKRFAEKGFYKFTKDRMYELSDIRIDYALVDEKTKAILTNDTPRGYQYDKDGLKAVIKAERDMYDAWDAKEFDVEEYIMKPENLPEDLTEEQKELFAGVFL